MKYFCLLLLILTLKVNQIQAESRYTISGTIQDALSGESLIGANIFVLELKRGSATNQYGFYSMTIPEGDYNIRVSYIGYASDTISISLTESKRINIRLNPSGYTTEEVVITGEAPDKNVRSVEMSKVELSVEQVRSIPVVFGETDILKTLQLMPGIQSGGEGSTGLYVRGGGPDQNLILLDGATVYNAAHLFGFFSVFNTDAINNFELLKGGMPARYGGRVSSVLNISLKEGNDKKFGGEGGIGLISSRLLLEGPIVEEKASFMIAGRRTYADVLAQPFLADSLKGNRYYFYDLNAKVNYRISDVDRIYLSGYFGRDVFNFESEGDGAFSSIDLRTEWGNSTATLRWNRIFNDKLFGNLSLMYNDYDFSFGVGFGDSRFTVFSGIRDYSLKADFDYYFSTDHHFKFGMDYTYHRFTPGLAEVTSFDSEEAFSVSNRYANQFAVYFEDIWEVNDRLMLNLGLRYSVFQQIGPYKRLQSGAPGSPPDTTEFSAWEHVKLYHGLEPRASFRYFLNDVSSIKGALTKNNQYIHLASATGGTLPTDLWVPSSDLIKPQISYQATLGYFRNLFDNSYEVSVETYYKYMENQVDFRPGADLFLNPFLDEEFLQGRGDSYGIEFLISKVTGNLTGWLGYTWSNTSRKIDEINNGERYSTRYDITHDLSLILSYRFNKKWDASVVFVYSTGQPYTPQVARYAGNFGLSEAGPDFTFVSIYPDEINSYRFESYHRADISVNYRPQRDDGEDRWFQSYWNFSIYNVYNRKNPYFYDFAIDQESGRVQARKVYIFPILPSVTYNFKF